MKLKLTAIIPSLNPDEKLPQVVNDLISVGFEKIIIVDDGSATENKHFFSDAVVHPCCTILTHSKNLGKGRALKTAFNYFLANCPDDIGVITVDGDGQHLASDVVKCAEYLCENPDNLILGVRSFNSKIVPPRSKFGNKITCFAFKNLCGISVTDTQTGLRAIPRKFIMQILDLPGERFDYETNMLLETKRKNVPVKEVPIKAVYIEGNTSSHFNPLKDSLSIYKVIAQFIWSSIAAMLCDFSLFIILKLIFNSLPLEISLLLATVGARIVSSLLNFIINKKLVFTKEGGRQRFTIVKYYSLCIIQTMLSYIGVYLLVSFVKLNSVLAKVIIDSILFLCSFKLQLTWVFKN